MDFNGKTRSYWGIIFLILFCAGQAYPLDIPLGWNYDKDCDTFRIYRSEKGQLGWPRLVGEVPCTERTFIDGNVPRGNLEWVVTAIKDGLESNASNSERYAYYYPRVRYDMDAQGHILYKGENANYAATDEDVTWVITKYYYDAQWRIIEIRVREGSWTNRDQEW